MNIRSEEVDAVFGRAILQHHLNVFLEELGALKRRPSSAAGIHQTRVQSRRCRAALEAFEDLMPTHPWRALSERVRSITKLLGKSRETEVVLQLLGDLTQGGDLAENLGREYMAERFGKKLRRRNRKLKSGLRELDVHRLRARSELLLSNLGPAEGLVAVTAPPDRAKPKALLKGRYRNRNPVLQPSLFQSQENRTERARRIVGGLAVPILEFSARRLSRASESRIHALRIVAKRLRYALEIFDQAWPGGLEHAIQLARAMQDAAGGYHDWCVLRDELRSEIHRLSRKGSAHLAFQLGRLLASADERKRELRKEIPPALIRLKQALSELLQAPTPPGAKESAGQQPGAASVIVSQES